MCHLAQNNELSNFECATTFEVIRFASYLKVESDLCRNNITKYEDTLETFALYAIGNRGKHLFLVCCWTRDIAHFVDIQLLLHRYIHKIHRRFYDLLPKVSCLSERGRGRGFLQKYNNYMKFLTFFEHLNNRADTLVLLLNNLL